MNNLRKNPHISSFIALSVIFLALVGGYAYSIWKINELQKNTDLLETDIRSNTSLIRHIDVKTVDQKEQEEKTDLSKLDSLFIKEGQEFTLIQNVEKICSNTGVDCTIQPVGIETDPNLPSKFHFLHLIINADGSFEDLYQFLSLLENLPEGSAIFRADFRSSGTKWAGNFDIKVVTVE